MGLIREPLDVDFVVDPRPLTNEEKEKISAYIRAYKARQKKHTHKKTLRILSSRKKVTA